MGAKVLRARICRVFESGEVFVGSSWFPEKSFYWLGLVSVCCGDDEPFWPGGVVNPLEQVVLVLLGVRMWVKTCSGLLGDREEPPIGRAGSVTKRPVGRVSCGNRLVDSCGKVLVFVFTTW